MTPPDSIPYRRWFPWLSLFQAIGMAFSLRQLIVAAGAIWALSLGQWLTEGAAPDAIASKSEQVNLHSGQRSFDDSFESPRNLLVVVGQPWCDLMRSVADIVGRDKTTGQRLLAVGVCLWIVAVWSLFGLALCRLAARRFAQGDCGSFRKSVQFGLTRWIQGIIGPLIPSAAAALVIGLAIVIVFAGRLPWIGPTLAVMVSPVLAICSLVGGYLLISMLLGWPLMIAAIAYDDCDAFGGLSRSYSHWTGRPWYFVWSWGVAACVGMLSLTLANGLGRWTDYLSEMVIQAGIPDDSVAVSTGLAVRVLILFVIHAYAISFFWTTATIIYALLRQSVDWMPLDKLALDDDERPLRDPLPVVGMPAMQADSGIRVVTE